MVIEKNHTYRAKSPRSLSGFYNDRHVIEITRFGAVIYKTASLAPSNRYPQVSMEKFVQWAGEDITGKLPDGRWEVYPYKR